MLLWFVILYLMVSVGIGLVAATRVHSAKDFAVAGRSLPLPVVTATVFATWFGAEAVFGVSSTFVKDGWRDRGGCGSVRLVDVPHHRRGSVFALSLQAQHPDAGRFSS